MHADTDQLATEAGIASNYLNTHGEWQSIAPATRHKLLAAMQFTDSSATTTARSEAPLARVKIVRHATPITIAVSGSGEYQWQLQLETGVVLHGSIGAGDTLKLADDLPLGYHQLQLHQGEQQWCCRLIITPHRCYQPRVLAQGARVWGTTIQLYTLRSARNWGIGDFADLRSLIGQLAPRGAAFVGINPIHALYPARPENASPYSPSSRRWLNMLYIAVDEVEAFQHSKQAQQWWQQPAIQRQLAQLRQSDWVNYTAVMALKLQALKLAFAHFQGSETLLIQQAAFAEFVQQGGIELHRQATFDALQATLISQNSQFQGWQSWPDDYRHYHSAAVATFCQQQAEQIRFYQWLQWLAVQQLTACAQLCQQQQMSIGLYGDLAVGVAADSAETWSDSQLYCLQASIGAPPDPLGPLGQNWQLPPVNPQVLTTRAYQPFIDLLRANMAYYGALRIDHVMALQRLWWVPAGEHADQGGYVHYPCDDLLALLALESQRQQCMVIGEDLGTVPAEMRDKLHQAGIYTYKVLYFEHDHAAQFRTPADYPPQAFATLTTHDLPTLYSYWQSDDLTLGERLGLYPDGEKFAQLQLQREQLKQGLLSALQQHGYLDHNSDRDCIEPPLLNTTAMSAQLSQALHCYLADSQAALLGLQPEDWIGMVIPVNIPGTDYQYPNWRRKLSMTLEALFNHWQVNQLLQAVALRRQQR
ncbi:4-alpha-glucanotransferase [Serratia microhaemolytica]|uniref:4-alpha-glucanotransferase n=1 Tax=Serratia microhaemolytica TaxID=2675110 RepID=UPI000FDD1C5C|nr:4-alpha-glucanotransferase [Serratia microhaemolytica]